MIWDVAIAGGGPAGLAAAIRAQERGLRAVVLERGDAPFDKACGEGLMPSGARQLALLGVRVASAQPLRGIRYLQGDRSVEARFRGGEGLGIRRTLLALALQTRAREAGASLQRATVQGAQAEAQAIEVRTDRGPLRARLLVAADGLHSPLRRAAGLGGERAPAPQRFGVRRHFELPPWSDLVEVHWSDGVEAYVTPVGPRSVNVAFLADGGGGFAEHLQRFPRLNERLSGAPFASEARGAGPLLQRVRARHGPRLALLGDAAGYVDAITGQGLSLAFASAALLMASLPQDLSCDLSPALRRYDRGLRAKWLRYALPARALVGLSRRPRLRRRAIGSITALPRLFGALVSVVG